MGRGPKFSEAILTLNLLCVIRPGKRNNRQNMKKQAIQEVAAEPLSGRAASQAGAGFSLARQEELLANGKAAWVLATPRCPFNH